MIAFLRGYVAAVYDGAAVIDVGGVGYEVRAAGETIQRLSAAGRDEEILVYTYTYLREDQIALYGFTSREDLELFKLLITVSGGGMSGNGTDHIGIMFGLGAAVLYATVVLLNKFIKNVGGIQRTFLQFVAAAVTLLPYVLLTGGIHLAELDARGWIFLLIVGLLHTGVAYCMYFSSLQYVPGQEAAVLSYIDPLVAVILSVTVLHEGMSLLQVVGGAMILGFTLLNELPEK